MRQFDYKLDKFTDMNLFAVKCCQCGHSLLFLTWVTYLRGGLGMECFCCGISTLT